MAHGAITANKTFTPSTMTVTGTSTVTITLGNTGTVAATGAAFTDNLPAGLIVANPSNAATTCVGAVTAAAGASSFSLAGGSIAANGGSCTVTVSVTASALGSYTNTIPSGSVTTSQGSNGSAATASLAVVASTRVTGSVAYSPTVLRGDGLPVTVTITLNNANTMALTNVSTTFNLQTAFQAFASTANLTSTCGPVTLNTAAGTGTLSGGTIPANGNCTIKFDIVEAAPNTSTSTTSSVSIAASNLTSAQGITNNGITGAVSTQAGGAVGKAFSPTSIASGETSTLTLTLSNRNVAAISPVNLTDTLPAGMTIAPTPGVTNTCGGTVTAAAGSGSIQLSGGSLAAAPSTGTTNATCTITVKIVGTTGTSNTTLTNSVPAGTWAGVGYSGGNASLSVTTTSIASVVKSFSPTSIAAGGTSTLTLVLRNFTTSAISPIALPDTFPSGLTVAATPNITNTCGGTVTAAAGAGSLQLSGGSLPAAPGGPNGASSCTITVAVTAAATGSYANTIPAGNWNGVPYAATSATLTVTNPFSVGKGWVNTDYLHNNSGAVNGSIASAGADYTMRITLSNATTSPISVTSATDSLTTMGTGFTVAPTLVPSTTCAGGTVSAPAGGTSITLNGGTIPASGSCTITVAVRVPLNTTVLGNHTNTIPAGAVVTSAGSNATPVNSILTVVSPLQLSKGFSPSTVSVGKTSTLTIVVNARLAGSGTAVDTLTNISDTDNLPAGMVVATPAAVNSTCNGTVTAPAGGSSVAFSGVSLMVGTSCTIKVNVFVPTTTPPGTLGNGIATSTATTDQGVTNSNTWNFYNLLPNNATANLTVVATSVTVGKSFSPATVAFGATSQMQIQLVNSNPNNVALSGAAFTDALPAGMVVASTPGASLSGCTGTVTATAGASTVALSGGSIAAGATCTLKVNVTSTAAGNLVNTIPDSGLTTTQGISNVGDASATLSVSGNADISVTKTDGVASLASGNSTTYTIVVRNAGPDNVSGILVNDSPPSGMTFGNWTCTASSGAVCGATSGSGAISNEEVTVNVGSTVTYSVTATLAANYSGASVTNTATVTAPGTVTDSNQVNNTASDTDSTAQGVVLALTKTDNSTTYTAGGTAVYTITVANTGLATATQVNVTDALPSGVTLNGAVTCSAGGTAACGTISGASGQSSFGATGAVVPSGAANTLTFTVPVSFASTLTTSPLVNTVTATDTASGATGSANDSDTLSSMADVSIVKSGPASVTAGSPIAYTLTIHNAGPGPANGTTFNDPVPAGIASISASCGTASGGAACPASVNVTGNTVSGTVPTLPPGGSVVVTINGMTSSSGNGAALTNVATVAPPAGTTDSTPANNTSSVTTAQSSQADLSITKTDGKVAYVAGTTNSYTIVVANAGPSDAPNFNVSDVVPASLTGVTVSCVASGTGNCGTNASSGNNISFTGGSLNAGAANFLTLTVIGTVNPAATGNISNTATVSVPAGASYTDPDLGNNTATDTDTTLPQQIDLAITKTDNQTSYVPGAAITYTIVVTNAGPSTATGFSVADAVPASISGVTVSCAVTGVGNCGSNASSGNNISFTNASLNPGAASNSLTFTVSGTVDASASGNLINTATVTAGSGATETNTANNTATDTDVQGVASADLAITKDDGQSTYVAGSPVSYTINVTNNGPSNAPNFNVRDVVPANITGVTVTCTPTGTGNNCGTNGSTGNTVSYTGANLNAGVGNSLTLIVSGTVSPAATGSLTNTAAVIIPTGAAYTDPNLANNNATDTDASAGAVVDLAITKDDGQTSYVPGAPITYTVVVTNNGPSLATGFTVSDTVPAAITGVTVTCAVAGTGNCGADGSTGNTVSFTNATLSPGAGNSLTLTISGTVAASTTGPLSNTATVAVGSGTVDSDLTNNSATDIDTQGQGLADLSIVKDDGSAVYVAGTPITYQITVKNNGPSNAPNFSISDAIPAQIGGATIACAVGTGTGNCGTNASSGNTLSFTGASLTVGSTLVVTVSGTISPAATGNLVNTATVAVPPGQGYTDPNSSNDSSTDTDTTTPQQIDLAITKTDSQTSYVPGTPITYTIVVTNAGPSTATGFSVADAVPAAITGVTVTCTPAGAGNSCGSNASAGNNVSFTNATLNPGAGNNLTLTVSGTVSANATGDLSNTATVTAGSGSTETNPANNSAVDTDTQDTAQVDLAITKTDNQMSYVPGTPITYTIVVTNAGPSTATGFSIADAVPAAITGVSVTCTSAGTGNSCGSNASAGNNVSFTNATLNPGAGNNLTLTVSGTVSANATGDLSNTATVTAGSGSTDTNPANNSAIDTDTQGTAQVDLAITKTDSQTSYVPGTPITYTIVVTNAGPSIATGFSIADAVPAAITGVTVTCTPAGTGNSCGSNASAGNNVSFTNATLSAGTGNSLTLTVSGTVSANATGDLSNTATVTAGSGSTDTNPANNSAVDTDTQGTAQVDLSIAKVGPATAKPGDAIQYTLTVSNAGQVDATGFSIADVVPSVVTVSSVSCAVTGTGSCGTDASAGNNVSFTGAALSTGAGNVLTITINGNIAANAAGSILNTATVTAGAGAVDVSTNNNSSAATTALTPVVPPTPPVPTPTLSWEVMIGLILLLLNIAYAVGLPTQQGRRRKQA